MNKKGMSLVEIMAVIVIMGIVASIGTVSAVAIIDRQRKNSVISALNNIYGTAKNMLYQVQYTSHDEYIVIVDETFCYVTLTDMIDNAAVDREDYKPEGNEIYFCYNMDNDFWIEIGNSATSTKPTSTGEALVHGVNVTVDYTNNVFKKT